MAFLFLFSLLSESAAVSNNMKHIILLNCTHCNVRYPYFYIVKILNMTKLFLIIFFLGCQQSTSNPTILEKDNGPIVAAERLDVYKDLLVGKRIGIVANHTSRVADKHLVDVLLENELVIKKIFSPEHGFRGTADAGEKVESYIDEKTKLPVFSLYGKNRKPKSTDLEDLDVILFDIQDVGVRFYTYISTLHYVMEACAENNVELIVLDRPNPNAHYIDGPVLKDEFRGFVGMHNIPVIYGMTIGELAQMINGESWLEGSVKANLKVIPCQNYSHQTMYDLPIKPSPNLPNLRSILLYPSLCFFEGTNVSVGRGTNSQFQVLGSPILGNSKDYNFKPQSNPGSKYPKHENKICWGDDFRNQSIDSLYSNSRQLDISLLIEYYKLFQDQQEPFFLENNFIDKLAGTNKLRLSILNGVSESEIRSSWQSDLEDFKLIREKYLLYE